MATTKKTTEKATTKKTTATKEEKTMAKTTTKKTTAKAEKTTAKKTAEKATTKKATEKATAKTEKKTTAPKKTTAKKDTAPKKTTTKKAETKAEVKKTAPKKEKPITKIEERDYIIVTKLNNMKGGDRIYPKADKDDWYMKIPSGVFEGRYESHKYGKVFTAEELDKMLKGKDCSVSKRKAMLLETFYEKKEDLYRIPSNWMTECWVEVMAKLEKGEDKDGYRFCLFADKKADRVDYLLIEMELDF